MLNTDDAEPITARSEKKKKKKKQKPVVRRSLDEEMRQFQENMATVYLTLTKDTEDNILNKDNNDDDEDDEFFEDALSSCSNDTFSKIEELRIELEQEMGEEKFCQAYTDIRQLHEGEEDTFEPTDDQIKKIVGDKKELYNRVLSLLFAEGAFTHH